MEDKSALDYVTKIADKIGQDCTVIDHPVFRSVPFGEDVADIQKAHPIGTLFMHVILHHHPTSPLYTLCLKVRRGDTVFDCYCWNSYSREIGFELWGIYLADPWAVFLTSIYHDCNLLILEHLKSSKENFTDALPRIINASLNESARMKELKRDFRTRTSDFLEINKETIRNIAWEFGVDFEQAYTRPIKAIKAAQELID